MTSRARVLADRRIDVDYDRDALTLAIGLRRTKYGRFRYHAMLIVGPFCIDVGFGRRSWRPRPRRWLRLVFAHQASPKASPKLPVRETR